MVVLRGGLIFWSEVPLQAVRVKIEAEWAATATERELTDARCE